MGFLRNLLGAVGQGVRQFMTNILAHLRDGVIAWLTGPVARAGIQMPERWDLRGIIWFVLQILGLTWARVRAEAGAADGRARRWRCSKPASSCCRRSASAAWCRRCATA